jgi:hypothetical protein
MREDTKHWHQLAGRAHLEVVAPPISSGIFIANLSISLATKIISSREGVMSPDRPIISRRKNSKSCEKRVREKEENYADPL